MRGSGGPPCQTIGRYAIYGEISAGGMAIVHYGRLLGPAGFSRTVAIKRLFPQFARDPEFVTMFLDEARLAARIRHPNVVDTLDIVAAEGELFLVMDYVQGESLARLLRQSADANRFLPLPIVSAIVSGALHGLHAAHEATNELGEPLGLVHRDVSPQNVLVGSDGVPRVLDFGVAKALGRLHTTRDGQVKGKLAYMAPEQLKGEPTTRRADLFAVGVVLWQALTGRRLFDGETEAIILAKLLEEPIVPPSRFAPHVRPELDQIALRALARDPARRFTTAREMALALETAERPATASEVSAWVESVAATTLAERARQVADIERSSTPGPRPLAEANAQGNTVPRDSLSQVSSISVTRPQRSPRVRSSGLLIAVFVAIALSAYAAIVTLRRPAPPAPAVSSDVAPVALAAESPSPSASALPSGALSSSSAPAPSASAALEKKPSSVRPVTQAPKSRSSSKANADCYYVDADGIRHIRATCR